MRTDHQLTDPQIQRQPDKLTDYDNNYYIQITDTDWLSSQLKNGLTSWLTKWQANWPSLKELLFSYSVSECSAFINSHGQGL